MKNKYIKILLLSTPMLLSSMSADASGLNFDQQKNDFLLELRDPPSYADKVYRAFARKYHSDKSGSADENPIKALNAAKTEYDAKVTTINARSSAHEETDAEAADARSRAAEQVNNYETARAARAPREREAAPNRERAEADRARRTWWDTRSSESEAARAREAADRARQQAEEERGWWYSYNAAQANFARQQAETARIFKENEAKKFRARSNAVGGAFNDFLHGTSNTFEARSVSVASGNEEYQDKIWVKGFGGIGKSTGAQSSNNQHYGATIGVDFQTSDINVLGFAYTYGAAKSIIKNSDNMKATANIGSIYGALSPHDSKFFVLGHLSAGNASISGLTGKNSKHKAALLKTKVSLGYKFTLENDLTLTPKAGVAYNIIKITAPEKKALGRDNTNYKISGLVTDLSLSLAKEINVTQGVITPEIHVGVSYGEQSVDKQSQITKLNKSSKKEKLSYNIGSSIKAVNASNVDLMIGYDCNVSKKYIGHNGFAKLIFKL